MTTIDLNRIREGLPKHAKVSLEKHDNSPCIKCKVQFPSLSEEDFEMCKQWQRDILGEVISEFYTETTGSLWYVYLKRIPLEFVNVTDGDMNSFVGMEVVRDGKLNQR